jgi:hypothetical protein
LRGEAGALGDDLKRRTAVAVVHVVETHGVFAGGELHGAGLTAALDGADHGPVVDEEADGGVGLRRERVFAGARHEELAREDEGELAGFLDGRVGEAGGHAGGDGRIRFVGTDAAERAGVEAVGEIGEDEAGVGFEAFVGETADRDGAVVALNHERAEGRFGTLLEKRAAGGAGDLDVFVDEVAVEEDFGEAGVFRFLAGGVETRGLKLDVERLPEAGGAAGVGAGRGAVVALVALAAGGVPARVNAPAVGGRGRLHAPTIEELHLVTAHQVDAGIRAGAEEKFEIELDIAVLPRGEQVAAGVGRLAGIADEDAGAGGGAEGFVATRVAGETAGEAPIGRGGFEGGEGVERHALGGEQRLGARGDERGNEDGDERKGACEHAGRAGKAGHGGKWGRGRSVCAGAGANWNFGGCGGREELRWGRATAWERKRLRWNR